MELGGGVVEQLPLLKTDSSPSKPGRGTVNHQIYPKEVSKVLSFPETFPNADPLILTRLQKSKISRLDEWGRTRLSPHFIMRDFLYSARGEILGIPNYPQDDVDQVIRSGKLICEKVCEPILAEFGRFAITYGYQNRTLIEAGYKPMKKHSSDPHHWDRGTFGKQVYARIDILPFAVEDGKISKWDFGKWVMFNLDIDLLMQWHNSNTCCITISPKPRRVWLEWGSPSQDQPKRTTFMGREYWQSVYPTLPEDQRPRFGPSCTGGSMQWRGEE